MRRFREREKNEFVTFMGASTTVDDEGRITEYMKRGEIVVNVHNIGVFYDHTIFIMGHKIRVMETMDEILDKLNGR